jgi:DNA-directed RNA polymerase subunit N (RpoN/RPB10)
MEPVLCYSCGKPVSNIYDVFMIMKKHHLENKSDVQDNKLYVDPKQNKNLLEIFEQLNIHKYCCRIRFTSVIEFDTL